MPKKISHINTTSEQTMASEVATVAPEQLRAVQLCKQHPASLDVHTTSEYRTSHIPGTELLTAPNRRKPG